MIEETKIITQNIGKYDAGSVEGFKACDGFKGLEKALSMSPQEVVDVITASGLRGRGGAGFPVG